MKLSNEKKVLTIYPFHLQQLIVDSFHNRTEQFKKIKSFTQFVCLLTIYTVSANKTLKLICFDSIITIKQNRIDTIIICNSAVADANDE